MKRLGYLFPQICAFENLWAAWRKARLGKRSKMEVLAFAADLEKNLHEIARRLRDRTWQPSPYATFTVYEGKPRLIAAAPFRDRVVHHALVNILDPIFEPTFIDDLYSNRKAKGTHAAVRRAQHLAQTFPYVLHLDMRKYFPSINREILLGLMARKVKCPDTLELLRLILEIHQPGLETGLPIGNQTSQFFANIYLNPVDHLIKEELRVPGYLRYVDDLWLFGADKKGLWQCKATLDRFLDDRLKLTIKSNGANLYAVEHSFPCLGYRLLPRAVLMKREAILRFRRKVRIMQRAYTDHRLELDAVRASLMGTMGHFRQGDTQNLRDRLLYEAVFTRGKLSEVHE